MIRKLLALGLTLAATCAVAAFGLAYTYSVTRDRILEQIRQQQIAAARAVLPEVASDEDFKERPDLAEKARAGTPEVDKIFEGSAAGNLAGWAVQVLPRGYGGPITLMVGVSADGRVKDVRVVDSKETPGLGDGVSDPAWSGQFQGRTVRDQLKVNKDIDGISGATISSKAVTRGVRQALEAVAAIGPGGAP